MYQDFFRLSESPFAIVPNPKFYFLSERHREALSHVLNGIEDGGGLALLTGEVGTGKTTTMKALLDRLPEKTQVATILNPSVSTLELMQTLCDELGVTYKDEDSFKRLYDLIADKLFNNESKGIQTVLLVDEAQHLMPDVLEQLRLLTNIETSYRKLLKVILIGQPELQEMLRQPNLRQLAQRITARYHLMPLSADEVHQYITHRISCAGGLDPLFDGAAIKLIAKETGGVPRLVNLVCDKSLKMAFKESRHKVNKELAERACQDVLEWQGAAKPKPSFDYKRYWPVYAGAVGGAALLAIAIRIGLGGDDVPVAPQISEPVANAVVVAPSPQPSAAAPETVAPVVVVEASKPEPNVDTLPFNTLVRESLSAGAAMQSLYKLWGFDADVLAASCSAQVRGELACYKGELPLSQLLTIDRPAVLQMNGPQGQSWFAVLYGKGDGQFELLAADRRVLVSEQFVNQFWSGEALILWRPPLGNPNFIKFGQRGERVQWLDQRLNLVLGDNSPVSNQFGQAQRNKVRDFQRSKGLDADGIPGAMTFMVLDTVLQMPGPMLIDSITATPAEQKALEDGEVVEVPSSDVFTLALTPLPQVELVEVAEPEPKVEQYGRTNVTAPNQTPLNSSDELTLDDLDLSELSPELAQKVEAAMSGDKSRTLDAKLERAQPASNVIPISQLSADMLDRLPAMDFQSHVYASNENSRRVKVNGKDAREGEFVAEGVLLRGIEPQQVVVQFENELIAIPALTKW
ncbi:AAA family ATPase [Enterovibrio paralichthyis]|uniref:AAA family ATPase n=1 Tax=Enterovibrio paralichthyis TaxID=2853805 RepID=UPI001C4436CD|nr:AAA family ATPase [Enterovibrio paralichthyis]MBV7300375.1 AAA family ATPase [Enterovibrio paralichthyis]